MRILLISLTFVFWAAAAAAGPLKDGILAALDEQNFSTLEVELTTAWNHARAKGDFAEFRRAFSNAFGKAHKERFAKTKAWQSARPDSFVAATALARMHLTRAFLLRGARSNRYTSAEAKAAFHRELKEAQRLVELARRHSPEFVPALDAALDLAMTGIGGDPLVIANRLIDVAPDYSSLRFAISALRPRWSGSVKQNILLCTTMAHKVPDYDAELCLIEVVFANDVRGALKDAAIAALAKRDEPFLDYIRIEVYMTEWRYEPEATAEIQRIHRASLNWGFDPDEFMNRTNTLVDIFDMPFFAAEMSEAALKTMAARLESDPQNHRLAEAYIRHSFHQNHRQYGELPEALKNEIIGLWPDMLELGRFSPEVWETGRKIMAFRNGWHDIAVLIPFARNRLYYSNHSPNTVRNHMSDLYGVWELVTGQAASSLTAEQLEATKHAVECPLVRASRLYEEICRADPSAMGCNVGGWAGMFPEHARRMGRKSEQCAHLRDAEFKTLAYTPVDISPNIFNEEPLE